MYEIFSKLLQEHGVTPYKVSKETGVSQSTLSDWKRGVSTPKIDKLQKIANYFGVSVEYLQTGKESEITDKKDMSTSTLTKRDTKQIEAILSDTEALLKQDGLMFDGDPASPEAIDSILSAMKIGMEMAKQKNKEKYTPKKYKKD
ncbi:helix-turn-helix domain-containing protein [Coprococcus sp. AF27-8]|uniref:helix-turn-helix domain-containing protein n=1 Tax=Faecalimonas umbilicata TaxID=1912855 RepID=UPI000E750071|nr:helix-turn-helix domain-containing protein [Faecalimonas umbilicata]MDY2761011.1 helix-turn-helix domain-containing protein [Faecalimonas umbilicata]RJV29535.1 helix-turn-helix domain-containing protein [Coprococcus sp. AF18-48]RJV73307.1 helix-turn-helix domain-containing protein [Coprococcus sp. AF27-8]